MDAFPLRRADDRRSAVLGALLFGLIAFAALWWAKWQPYSQKLPAVLSAGSWSGHSILGAAGSAGDSPSLQSGWQFTRSYFEAIWQAIVAGLLIAAAVDVLLPRAWLLRAMGRGHSEPTLIGGLAGTTSMMCTCCTAPVATTLRRDGAPVSASLAFWLANPLLNPVVVVFLAIVLPWQWVVTRVLIGGLLVFGVTRLLARHASGGERHEETSAEPAVTEPSLGERLSRYPRSLFRLSVTLLPEYLLVVFALGALRGVLFPFDGSIADWNVAIVVLAAIAGTLMVIPTAGEIPILQGLAAAGAPVGALGALLITLPAISLPSIAMASRAFSTRILVATAGAVAVLGLAAGALLWALGG